MQDGLARRMRPFGVRHVGLLILVLGGLAFGFSAIGLSGVPTPEQDASDDGDFTEALARFETRIENYVRLQAIAFGFLMAGAALTILRVPPDTPDRVALGVAALAAAIVAWTRWTSIALEQFGPTWDTRLGLEAAAWAAWAAALALLGRRWVIVPQTPGERP